MNNMIKKKQDRKDKVTRLKNGRSNKTDNKKEI